MRVSVQLLGADGERVHAAALSTRVEEGFFTVTEHCDSDTRSVTTRYPAARIAWVREETD